MTARARGGLIALGWAAGLCLGFVMLVYLGSEALIGRRYTLPSSIAVASEKPEAAVRGAHLARIDGCTGCHTAPGAPPMTGRMLRIPPGLRLAAPNLRHFIAKESATGLDIALHRALSPQARALWGMPSDAYAYLSDDDVADIAAYLNSLPQAGHDWPAKQFSFAARLAVMAGTLAPANPYGLGHRGPRYLGEALEGGRYLAMMSCTSCHGVDLNGDPKTGIGGLSVMAAYDRRAFFALMRDGTPISGHRAPEMAGLAKRRFAALHDWEIDGLYAYLCAFAGDPAGDSPP